MMHRCIGLILLPVLWLLPGSTTCNAVYSKYANHSLPTSVVTSMAEMFLEDEQGPISLRRHLGAFDELNSLFDGLVLALPDMYLTAGKILGATVRLWTTNLECFSISVDDIIINYNKRNNRIFDFKVDIQGLSISCDLNWRYKWSFTDGSGRGQVYTKDNNAQTLISFSSLGFDQHPPSGSSVSQCNAFIRISDMDFQGGIVASIIDTFERSLRGKVSDEINSAACEELGSLGTTLVGDMLDYVYDLIDGYLEPLPPEYEDSLIVETRLALPSGKKLIDFTDFGSTLGGGTVGDLFQNGLSLVDKALGSMTPDPDLIGATGDGLDLGINRLLRATVLNEDRAWIADLPDFAATGGVIFQGHDMLTETIITIDQFKLLGLDSFESFDPLNANGRYTLGNHFFWKNLIVELDLTLIMKPSSLSDSLISVGTDAEVKESITVNIGINEIGVDFHFFLGVDEVELGALKLGSILVDPGNIPSCVFRSLFLGQVTGFSVDVGDMQFPTLTGFISPGIDLLVSKAAESVFLMYEPTLKKATPNFFELKIRDMTNTLISNVVSKAQDDGLCSPSTNYTQTGRSYIHMGDLLLSGEDAEIIGGSGDNPYGILLKDTIAFFRDEVKKVNPITGDLYLNERIVTNITALQSGTPGSLVFPTEIFGSEGRISIGELDASFAVKVVDVKIQNLHSFGLPLEILEPSQGNELKNTITIGSVEKPINLSSEFTISFEDGENISFRNVLLLGLELKNTTIEVDALVQILETGLFNFPLEDMNNFDCWLAMIPAPAMEASGVRAADSELTLALRKLKIDMESTRIQIECLSCSSPLFQDLDNSLSSDEAIADLTKLANGAVDYITGLLGGPFLQAQIDRALVDAPKRCPHSPDFVSVDAPRVQYQELQQLNESKPTNWDFIIAIGSVIVSVLLIAAVSTSIVQMVKWKRHKKWLGSLSDREVMEYKAKHLDEQVRALRMNANTTSMFKSSIIPGFMRYFIPISIIANIGFFLSGHISLGASVDIEAQIGGEAIRIKELFVFSMAESVVDMWEAGATELAILIALFSGAWPYTKQFVVFFLWFAPPKITSVSRREGLLLWLDRLGKWSFVDIFILVMSVPSFRVQINSPDTISFLPSGFYDLNLLLIPCWGLYSNMIAQIISQFNSHLIIHYHRKIVFDFDARERGSNATENEIDESDTEALFKHKFDRFGAKKGHLLVLRKGISALVVLMSVVFATLLLAGSIVPSFSLSQFGLVGLAVEVSPDQSTYNEHNIFSTIKLLIDQAKFTGATTDAIGLASLSTIVVLTVIIVPLCQLVLLLLRWFGTMDKKRRIRTFVTIEALQAWQYVEVFVFSVIIACWQLGSVSEFLINDYCGSFESTFNSLAYYGILKPDDSQCFKVVANTKDGLWLLVAASVVFLLLNHFIASAAKQQEADLANSNSDISIQVELEDISDLEDFQLRTHPASFTDYYRWVLL